MWCLGLWHVVAIGNSYCLMIFHLTQVCKSFAHVWSCLGMIRTCSFSFLVESCDDLWNLKAMAENEAAIAECKSVTGQPPSISFQTCECVKRFLCISVMVCVILCKERNQQGSFLTCCHFGMFWLNLRCGFQSPIFELVIEWYHMQTVWS